MTFSHQSCNGLSNFRSLQDAEYIGFLALSQHYFLSSLNQNYFIRVGKYILKEGEWKKFEITYILTNSCTDYLEKITKMLYYYFTIQQNSTVVLILLNTPPSP